MIAVWWLCDSTLLRKDFIESDSGLVQLQKCFDTLLSSLQHTTEADNMELRSLESLVASIDAQLTVMQSDEVRD